MGPQGPDFNGELAERSNAAVLKTASPSGLGGSNPSLSAREAAELRLRCGELHLRAPRRDQPRRPRTLAEAGSGSEDSAGIEASPAAISARSGRWSDACRASAERC